MSKKNNINNKNIKKEKETSDNSKLINSLIIVGIFLLIGVLIYMFINSSKTENYIKEISYNEYLDIAKQNKYSIILLTSPTCSHCVSYKPAVNYLVSEYHLDVYNVNLTKVEYDEYLALHDRFSAIKNQFGESGEPQIPTPTTIITKNDGEVASIIGDIGYNGLLRLLKNNKVIE